MSSEAQRSDVVTSDANRQSAIQKITAPPGAHSLCVLWWEGRNGSNLPGWPQELPTP